MSGIIGRLRARLGLDAGPFDRGLRQSQASARAFANRVKFAIAGIGASLAAAFSTAALKNAMATLDAQAKLARSLGTTSQSLQVLTRAGDLAGVSLSGIETGTKDLQRRLSAAAAGSGPAAAALDRLGLSANDLLDLPLAERVSMINARLGEFVPAAERAAVAGQLFGEEGALAMTRLDPAVIRQATEEVRQFGFAISETDASKIELANDSLSKVGLVLSGLVNQIVVAVAPALGSMADGLAAVLANGAPLRVALERLGENIGRIATYAATFAAFMATQYVAALTAAAFATGGLTAALQSLRNALIRTGIGALVVGAGELVYQFSRLVKATGGFGAALQALGNLAGLVWQGIVDSAAAVPVGLNAIWQRMRAGFLRQLSIMGEDFAGFVSSLSGVAAQAGLTGLAANLATATADIQRISASIGNASLNARDAAASAGGAGQMIADAFAPAREAAAALGRQVATTTEEIDDATPAVDRLNEALGEIGGGAGGGSGGGSGGGTAGAAAREIGKIPDALEDVTNHAKTGAQAITGLFSSILDRSKSVGDALKELVKRFAEVQLQNAIMGAAAGGGRGIFGTLGRLLTPREIPGFANGTNFAPGGLAMVGERGRELVRLPRGSQVIPNGRTERMMRGGAEVRVTGGDLTLTDDGAIAARIRVTAQQAGSQAVAAVKAGLPGWQDQYARHGVIA